MRGLVWARHLQHIAKLGQEQRIIGALLSALANGPTGDE